MLEQTANFSAEIARDSIEGAVRVANDAIDLVETSLNIWVATCESAGAVFDQMTRPYALFA